MITRTKSPSRSQSNSERNLQTNKSLVSGYYQTTPARKLTVNSKRLAKRKKRRKTYEQRPQSRRHFSQEGVPCFLVHPVSSRGERWNNNGADWRQAARPLQYATRQQHSTLSLIYPLPAATTAQLKCKKGTYLSLSEAARIFFPVTNFTSFSLLFESKACLITSKYIRSPIDPRASCGNPRNQRQHLLRSDFGSTQRHIKGQKKFFWRWTHARSI